MISSFALRTLGRVGLSAGTGNPLRRAFSIIQGVCPVNGVDIAYSQSGDAEDVVLCIPGALGSGALDFAPQMADLGKDFTLVAIDPRGFGNSRPPDREFSLDCFDRDADDCAGLMKALGHEKYAILGWSDGANIGALVADKYAESVRGLVMMGGNSHFNQDDIDIYEQIRDVSKWSGKVKRRFEHMYGLETFQDLWSRWIDCCTDIMNDPDKFGDVCYDSLARIMVPTLVLHGEKDKMVPLMHAHLLAATIPQSALVLWPEGSHDFHLRDPLNFDDYFRAYMDKIRVMEEQIAAGTYNPQALSCSGCGEEFGSMSCEGNCGAEEADD